VSGTDAGRFDFTNKSTLYGCGKSGSFAAFLEPAVISRGFVSPKSADEYPDR
jgi:hypothetical protein